VLKGNAWVTASGITTTSNICQIQVVLPPGFGTLTMGDTQTDLIDSAYYVIKAGAITGSMTVGFQILTADNVWTTLVTPNTITGAATPVLVTCTASTNYMGSLNLPPSTTAPAICIPCFGVRMVATITTATLTFAQLIVTKR
jgi:hypothetical protein